MKPRNQGTTKSKKNHSLQQILATLEAHTGNIKRRPQKSETPEDDDKGVVKIVRRPESEHQEQCNRNVPLRANT